MSEPEPRVDPEYSKTVTSESTASTSLDEPTNGAPRATGTSDRSNETANATEPQRSRRRLPMSAWVAGVLAVLAGELYIYGHDGWIRVCVGREGITDLSLLEQPRTHGGSGGYPVCAEQLNLGMYSRSDEAAREALEVACVRGAALLRGDKTHCLRKERGWLRRVDKEQIPPWDSRLYRRLFFLD